MSSSRSTPFSFSPDVAITLGPPGEMNGAIRASFPQLFDGSVSRLTRDFHDNLCGHGILVRQGVTIPPRTIVAMFTGHMYEGATTRGDFSISLPPFFTHGVDIQLSVDGAAQSARYPTSTQAALIRHSCSDPTVAGEWWHGGVAGGFHPPVLIARTLVTLYSGEDLTWNFDDLEDPRNPYTLSPLAAESWRDAGNATIPCRCNEPAECPLLRHLRAPPPDGPIAD